MSQGFNEKQDEVMREFVNDYQTKRTRSSLDAEYADIRDRQQQMREDERYSCSIGQKPQNFALNRYRDIIPYNKNRVILTNVRDNPDGYVNASHVTYGGKKFIAAQAPVKGTVPHFFYMISQFNVKVVAMVCKVTESFQPKCEQYWPEKVGEKATFGSFTSTLLSEETFSDYIQRSILIENEEEKTSTQIEQVNYTEWPDHGSPNTEKKVISYIKQMNAINNDDNPILVHCSAGCGRTGTVIALDAIHVAASNGTLVEPINLKNIVLDLREQRTSMVQTLTQYHYLYKCTTVYFKELLGIDTETKSPAGPSEEDHLPPLAQPPANKLELPAVPRNRPPPAPKPVVLAPLVVVEEKESANQTNQETPSGFE